MKLVNLKTVQTYDIKSLLRKNPYLTSLSEYQLDKIASTIDETYSVYEWKSKPKEVSFLLRLSVVPLYLLVLLTFLIFCPLKYLVTGDFYLTRDSRYRKFLTSWSEKTKTYLL